MSPQPAAGAPGPETAAATRAWLIENPAAGQTNWEQQVRAAAATLRSVAPAAWTHLGGLILAIAVLCVLYAAVARSARR